MSEQVVVVAPQDPEGQLQDYSVDQAAGAIVLVLGAVASLLLVLWQSKCHCKVILINYIQLGEDIKVTNNENIMFVVYLFGLFIYLP